jgi:hypothetical protein
MDVSGARCLKALEDEAARLKKLDTSTYRLSRAGTVALRFCTT